MAEIAVAANGLTVAFQLTEACIKLYKFWETVKDAPQEINTIKDDLSFLISVFERVESHGDTLGSCLAECLKHCRAKIEDLTLIVKRFDDGLSSPSRMRRACTASKVALHSKHIQRFRDSLNDAKLTLLLAMADESILQIRCSHLSTRVEVVGKIEEYSASESVRQGPIRLSEIKDTSSWIASQGIPSIFVSQPLLYRIASSSTTNALQPLGKMLKERCWTDYEVKKLMLPAIARAAVTTLKPTSMKIHSKDGYTIDKCGRLQTKTSVHAGNLRHDVSYHVSTFCTAIGYIWLRITTIRHDKRSSNRCRKSQIIRSLILYPARWLQYIGIPYGFEAVVASGGRSWLFNCDITVTRPVPEDSLIFELCRTGQTRAVEALLEKRMASVVDTSPKGWKPLHFAAAAGHVDLCELLIEGGADKSALVYEGPSDTILSPISLFVASCTDAHADTKIAMLTLFRGCIDIADADADGWSVHDWLKRAYARERVPISQNSIMWLLHLSLNEEYVEFSARSMWSALQHAMRSVLNHARHDGCFQQILGLPNEELLGVSKRHLDAVGSWLALRVSGRVVLPMVVKAGSFLQMKGFDWMEDNLTHKQFLQALPSIYSAWCNAVLDCIEQLKAYLRKELDRYLRQLGMTQKTFVRVLTQTKDIPHGAGKSLRTACTHCGDDYGPFAGGLVEPARIAITECVKSGHNSNCVCDTIQKGSTILEELQDYTGTLQTDDDGDDTHADDEFFDAQPHVFNDTDLQTNPTSNMFTDIATLLYSAQGRIWLGEHSIGERLCSTCLLLKEKYIGEDGLSADFPPMPRSFEGLRVKW